jgi:hypothetical protein
VGRRNKLADEIEHSKSGYPPCDQKVKTISSKQPLRRSNTGKRHAVRVLHRPRSRHKRESFDLVADAPSIHAYQACRHWVILDMRCVVCRVGGSGKRSAPRRTLVFGLSRGRHESTARKRGRAAVFVYRTRARLRRAAIGVLSSRAAPQDVKYELVEKGSNGHRQLHQAAQRRQIGTPYKRGHGQFQCARMPPQNAEQ